MPCLEAQSQRKAGRGTALNRIVKKTRIERYSGEAIEAVKRFESEQRALSCFARDNTHAAVVEAMLPFIPVGHGVVYPVLGERKALRAWPMCPIGSETFWGPLGVMPIMVSFIPSRFSLVVPRTIPALACLDAGHGLECHCESLSLPVEACICLAE